MSRQFNGTSDFVTFSIGAAASQQGPITIAALIKPTSAVGTRQIVGAVTAGSAVSWGLLMDANSYYVENLFTSPTNGITNDWQWIVVTKASGNVAPTFHLKDVTTAGAWTHSLAGGTANNATPPAATIGVGGLPAGTRTYQGLVAAVVVWNTEFSSIQVENSCTLAASNLFTVASPNWGTLWNQGSTATPVPDFTSNGGNQTAITGTTVSGDDPPGFNYALVNTVSGTGVTDLDALSGTAAAQVIVPATAVATLDSLSAAATGSAIIHPGIATADLGALAGTAVGTSTGIVTGAALSDLGRLDAHASTPEPPDPDQFVSVLMEKLLQCLCEQTALQPNPPMHCCFRVGTEITHDAGILQDQCCEGIAYVALGDTYPSSDSFPEQDIVRQADAKCPPPTWAQLFKVGIIRCSPTGNEFLPPSCDEWNAAARQNVIDAQTLRRVACCMRSYIVTNNDLFFGMSLVIDRQIQGNPQGGCVERTMNLTIQFPNLCDGC